MEEKGGLTDGFVELVKTLVYALLLAGVIRTVFFQPFWIPSGSMKDTLLIGDFIFVNKMSYGYSWASCPTLFGTNLCGLAKGAEGRFLGGEPKRGDVVVFKHPITGADFVKRLIGLPGDTVQMKDGVLFLNGAEAVQVPAGVFSELNAPQGPEQGRPACRTVADGQCLKDRFRETLPGGVQHSLLNIGERATDNTGAIIVPEGRYFFMGDNRDNSADSRIAQPSGVGFVPAGNLIGRVDRVMFSSAGRSMLAFWTWRSDRFFKAVE